MKGVLWRFVWPVWLAFILVACFDKRFTSEAYSSCVDRTSYDRLLLALGINPPDDLAGLVEVSKRWLRAPGVEQWHMADVYDSRRDELVPLLGKMGFIDPVGPQKKFYDYAIVLGGAYKNMQKRWLYLETLWNAGVRVNCIVCTAGRRILEPAERDLVHEKLGVIVKDEVEIVQALVKNKAIPKVLQHIPLMIIDTPLKKGPDGKLIRPSTQDTIAKWLQTNPKPGSVLAVSQQPYVLYQDAVMRSLLPAHFVLQTVGRGAEYRVSIVNVLDSVARFLNWELKRVRGM